MYHTDLELNALSRRFFFFYDQIEVYYICETSNLINRGLSRLISTAQQMHVLSGSTDNEGKVDIDTCKG
jgi:hypothetical protein